MAAAFEFEKKIDKDTNAFLETLLNEHLTAKTLRGANENAFVGRIIYINTTDAEEIGAIPSYFHDIELSLAPAAIEVSSLE